MFHLFTSPRTHVLGYGCAALRAGSYNLASCAAWGSFLPLGECRDLVFVAIWKIAPGGWPGSSFVHYATGIEGVVEIESEWTGRKRERMGMPLRVQIKELPHPSKIGSGGAPSNS